MSHRFHQLIRHPERITTMALEEAQEHKRRVLEVVHKLREELREQRAANLARGLPPDLDDRSLKAARAARVYGRVVHALQERIRELRGEHQAAQANALELFGKPLSHELNYCAAVLESAAAEQFPASDRRYDLIKRVAAWLRTEAAG